MTSAHENDTTTYAVTVNVTDRDEGKSKFINGHTFYVKIKSDVLGLVSL